LSTSSNSRHELGGRLITRHCLHLGFKLGFVFTFTFKLKLTFHLILVFAFAFEHGTCRSPDHSAEWTAYGRANKRCGDTGNTAKHGSRAPDEAANTAPNATKSSEELFIFKLAFVFAFSFKFQLAFSFELKFAFTLELKLALALAFKFELAFTFEFVFEFAFKLELAISTTHDISPFRIGNGGRTIATPTQTRIVTSSRKLDFGS
jgi:hypothetical protein